MRSTTLPTSPIAGLCTVDLLVGGEAVLQRFFEANPAYFIAVNGGPAGPGEAREEIHGPLPAGYAHTKKWVFGYADASGELVAMANVITDLLAPRVWHIGSFIVATARHGSGDAQTLHRSLEDWAGSNGALWLRLGVVQGNARAERFWRQMGFVDGSTRPGTVMGRLTQTVQVMAKPLTDVGLEAYFELLPRDRPAA